MYGNSRNEIREIYFSCWANRDTPEKLEPVQKQILAIMIEHPEYHAMFNAPEQYTDADYTPENGQTNPFLHLGLHLAIRDQVKLNNPKGIEELYNAYVKKCGGNHLDAEHQIIESFASILWESMRYQREFDNEKYLEALRMHL